MIGERRGLVLGQEFSCAGEMIRKALQFDSRNDRAKTLLEKISGELRLIQIKSQVTGILERAQNLQREGRHQEPQSEAESALKLDPSSTQSRDLLEEAHRLTDPSGVIPHARLFSCFR